MFYIASYNKSSAVAEMGDRVRAKWVEKWGLLCPFPWGAIGSRLTQCRLVQDLPPYQVASWSIQPFRHNTPTLQTARQNRQDNGAVPCRANRCNGRPIIVTMLYGSLHVCQYGGLYVYHHAIRQ